jgi:RHS repeat-associated protein
VDTTLDPGTANALTTRSSQWLDEYGNLISSTTHDFGPSFAALRTVQLTYSYPTAGQHRDMYFFNRVTKVEVTQGGVTQTMQQTTYGDGSSLETGISCPAGAENFEGVYYCTSGAVRANVQAVTSGGVTTEFRYDYQGNMVRSWGASPQVTATYSGGTNYVLPELITPNSTSQLATSFTFDGAMRPTQSTAPNNAVARTWYDSAGRVNKTQSPVGSYTHYYFDYANRKNEVAVSASSSSTDLNNRTFSRSWFDGLGRPIKTESGGANTVLSITETEYAPCACSPTGKRKRVSLPYAPGGTVRWTTYTYDALGRTLSVTLPGDGLVPSAGATTYEYVKNTVKITDAATNWKKYETNALGELVKVIEPDPAQGADLETTYAYNIRGQLTTATMTRAGKTQVRTFVYDDTTGRLTSVTKPETGTTAYAYNADGTVLNTIDAKNQKTEFTYDSLKRVTAIKRFVNSGGVLVEQPCQQLNYTYDSGTGANLWGRVAKITSKSCEPYYLDEYSETFSYLSSGLLDYRDSRWVRTINPATTRTLRVQPTWNSYGQMTGYAYGAIGSLYSYTMSYDNAWRPAGLTGEGLTLVSAVNYNAAGAITGFERRESVTSVVTNTYGYNFLYQMTMQKVVQGTSTTLQELSYTFSADKNNGQITSQKDELSGETVVYQYDKLNRLIKAETTGAGGWGLSWTYDGFGNREQQTNLKGSVPVHSVSVDKLNNRIDSPGYLYDANGNMTQMPLMTMSYDVANRMVSSDHSSQGTTTYRYNHANQRIYMKTGTKISYFLYGLGGERLLEMEEQCGGNCWNYQETQRWIYFAGRKMFSKTGTTLKAVTPNRLASEAKHFPYGETDGTPPADTKDYFATYRRDTTGLDYAWNRYYSPTMGRFTTADPYGGSASLSDPQTWNRYAYVSNDPISRLDRNGLWMTSIHSENGDGYYICGISLWENPFSGWANICGYGPFSEEMFYLYQNGGGATSSTPRSTWSPRELALYWRSKAAEVGDCAAVAGFATDIANGVIDRGGTVKDFMDSFGVLTNADPSLPSGVKAASGRDFVSIPVAPSGSTFQTEFQNGFGSSTGARPDQAQSWHFSLFLQVGALYGGLASRANQGDIDALFSLNYALATAAVGVELAQDPLKALLDPNWGDVNLGTAAGRLGADIAGGVVPLSSVGAAIEDRMCKR